MEKLYNDIGENIKEIREKMAAAARRADRDPSEIQLMGVTKTVEPEVVNMAIKQGITLLGESRQQEMTAKIGQYDLEGVDVQFIGSLQSNKVRQVIDHVSMIQSVDRASLIKEIQRRAKAEDRVMDVLVQVNVGKEESKSGTYPENTMEMVERIADNYPNLRVRGIMSIPPFTDNIEEQKEYFGILRQLFVDIQRQSGDNGVVDVLSMGMSGDYETAIECGSTLVRVGTAIFGSRD